MGGASSACIATGSNGQGTWVEPPGEEGAEGGEDHAGKREGEEPVAEEAVVVHPAVAPGATLVLPVQA